MLLITIAVGLLLKYYHGRYSDFFNNSLAGTAYVIFWIIFFKIIFIRTNHIKITLIVTLITCLLEFLQLYNPPVLIFLRSYWLGKTLLGTTFNWLDFPFYFLATPVAAFIIARFR